VLAPYETMILETTPSEDAPLSPEPDRPSAELVGAAAERVDSYETDGVPRLDYRWRATLKVPSVERGELCILVEGAPAVGGVAGTVRVDNRATDFVRHQSVGQFGAAVEASPENWTWLIAALPAGSHDVEITLQIPLRKAAVGIFIRGSVLASNDSVSDEVVAFPTFQPERRPWSHTVRSLEVFGEDAPENASR
jgi:hypothetical protein